MVVANLEPIAKLTRDVKTAAVTMSDAEARVLVDLYYTIQEYRKAAHNQVRAMREAGEPHATIAYFAGTFETVERQIKTVLDRYTSGHPVGSWMKSIVGIGPVLAAGFLAHLNLERAQTVGAWWRFAGLDPTVRWEKGRKRPWNAELKVLCWKAGQSFQKVSNHPDDVYGKVYRQRKAYEQEKNERGEYAAQAAKILEAKRIGETTEAYKWYSQGKLPPAHIDARARRYAVKLFLAHLFEVMWRYERGTEPPAPYPIAHLDHAHKIDPPNLELIEREIADRATEVAD